MSFLLHSIVNSKPTILLLSKFFVCFFTNTYKSLHTLNSWLRFFRSIVVDWAREYRRKSWAIFGLFHRNMCYWVTGNCCLESDDDVDITVIEVSLRFRIGFQDLHRTLKPMEKSKLYSTTKEKKAKSKNYRQRT